MKNLFSKPFLAPLTVLVLASFTLQPIAEARDGGRGGGGGGARASAGGGGGARAGGGGGRQIDNSRADARTNNVRNTSATNVNASNRNVNANRNTNVNANRNVNVNVDGGSCCGGGWDNDYHPVAAAAVVAGTAAVIGSMVRTPPANCVPVNYGGMVYQQCGSTWYQPQGSQYIVVNPPY